VELKSRFHLKLCGHFLKVSGFERSRG
jgi:hypothetical protein